MLAWNRRDIEVEGLDFISRLRVKGYAREVERLTATTPEALHRGRTAALLPPPDGYVVGRHSCAGDGRGPPPCPRPVPATRRRT
jgi:hypothetical protein